MFRITQNITIPNISNTVTQGGRASLPVDPAFLIYSHFEHVYGRAAPQGTEGVAISQLKLLNVLIGRLAQVRTDPPPPIMAEAAPLGAEAVDEAVPGSIAPEAIDAARVAALIDDYRSQILQGMEASAAMPYIPSPNTQGGAVLNLVA